MVAHSAAPSQASREGFVRSSGRYAVVRGVWFPRFDFPVLGQPLAVHASPRQLAEHRWAADRAADDGGYEVTLDEIERAVYVEAECSYRGGGPFQLQVIKDALGEVVRDWVPTDSPGFRALVSYDGDDERKWAEGLDGFEAYDERSAMGYCVQGWIPVSEISDYRELVKDFPVPRRGESSL